MVISISVDQDVCQGYGNCVLHFPEAFDLGPSSVVELLQAEVSDDRAELVRTVVLDCPAGAIASSLDSPDD